MKMKFSFATFAASATLTIGLSGSNTVVVYGQETRVSCQTTADCPVLEDGSKYYCSGSDNTCLRMGDCVSLEDCSAADNVFAVPMIVGTMHCIADAGTPARCVQIPDGTPPTCSAFDACAATGLEGNCCPNDEGKYLACCAGITIAPTTVPGSWTGVAECSAYPNCVAAGLTSDVGGTTQCCPDDDGEYLECCYGNPTQETPVIMPSDPADPVGGEPESPVIQPSFPVEDDSNATSPGPENPVIMPSDPTDPVGEPEKPVIQPSFPEDENPVIMPSDPIDPAEPEKPVTMPSDPVSCQSDADCKSGEEYCSQGQCTGQGMCQIDEDCANPANFGWNDPRCRGYLHCNVTTMMCGRMCGEPCSNGQAEETDCPVTGCDRKIACPGSVACVADPCSPTCEGIHFDAAGSVLAECSAPVPASDDNTEAKNMTTITISTDGNATVSIMSSSPKKFNDVINNILFAAGAIVALGASLF